MPDTFLQRANQAGFTIIELIVIISIAGILAAFAFARLVDRDGFASRGFYDQAQAVVRYAQKTAIAQRRQIFVVVPPSGDRIGACYDSACTARVPTPFEFTRTPFMASGLAKCANDATWLCAGTSDGISLSVVSFSFDGLGRPSAGATITLMSTIAGDPARQIVVEAETGYVHP